VVLSLVLEAVTMKYGYGIQRNDDHGCELE
jgi:hypothetical protein